jgi:hypothetical protein
MLHIVKLASRQLYQCKLPVPTSKKAYLPKYQPMGHFVILVYLVSEKYVILISIFITREDEQFYMFIIYNSSFMNFAPFPSDCFCVDL